MVIILAHLPSFGTLLLSVHHRHLSSHSPPLQVGLMGVVVKARITRSNQTLEFPLILSHHWDDWRMVALAAVAPTLLYVAAERLVVRPLVAWQRAAVERAAREEHAEEVSRRGWRAGRERVEQGRSVLCLVLHSNVVIHPRHYVTPVSSLTFCYPRPHSLP